MQRFEITAINPNFVSVNNLWVGKMEENKTENESRLILPRPNLPCKCINNNNLDNRIAGNGPSMVLGNAAEIKIGCIEFYFVTAFNFT